MKWDRRTFFKLAGGAALGMAASPLLFKINDDVAIWTQNWSWVPKPDRGTEALAYTVNPLTHTGLTAKLVDGSAGQRLMRLTGNSEHPLSRGGALAADVSALQTFYNDDLRIKTPLLKNARTGSYDSLSWEQALNILSQKIKKASPQGLVALGHNSLNAEGELLRAFMASLGSPNIAFQPQAQQIWSLACLGMTGHTNLGFDIANAQLVLSFNVPLLEGFSAPVAARKAWLDMKAGQGRLVQIEPRASITASLADTWLPIKPGTETAVALGLCAIIVEKKLYDQQSLTQAAGFMDEALGLNFVQLLARDYQPDKVSRLSGLNRQQLEELAERFIKQKQALAVCGPAAADNAGDLFHYMAVLALNAMKGNLGQPGGVVKQADLGLKSLLDQNVSDIPLTTPLTIAQKTAQAKIKPEVVLVAGGNPAYAGPQAGEVEAFLHSAPFVCVHTPYFSETSQLADLILPGATFLECLGECLPAFAAPLASYEIHKPLLSPYPQSKSTGDMLLMLAAQLGGEAAQALPHADMDALLAMRSESLGDWDDIKGQGWFQEEVRHEWEYATASGGLEFKSKALGAKLQLSADNEALLPRQVVHKSLSQPRQKNELILAAAPSLRSGSGSQPTTPYMIKVLPDTVLRHNTQLAVEINPETALSLGFQEDDLISIDSKAGGFRARVQFFNGCPPGMVYMATGLGHTVALEDTVLGKGANYCRIAESGVDEISGLVCGNLTKVIVAKVKG